MPGWNFADVFNVVAQEIPDRPALIQGSRLVSWKELDHRAEALARFLAAAGLERQDKVAQYLHNTTEYLESVLGASKALSSRSIPIFVMAPMNSPISGTTAM